MFSPMKIIRRAKEARIEKQKWLAENPEGSSSGKSFSRLYKLGEKLGAGAFSVVKEGTHKQSGKTYAIKIVNKFHLKPEEKDALHDEISILKELDHAHIVGLYDVFNDPSSDYYYLVTEKIPGGCLMRRLAQKGVYKEEEAMLACRSLLDALEYTHRHNVVHRDLKLENLLLTRVGDDCDITIIDFGFAKRCKTPNGLHTLIGTPGYVAPCILEGVGYGTKADVWSLGIIIYCIMSGHPPFEDKDRNKLFAKIRKGKYEFPEKEWGGISDYAKDFISRLLTVNPFKRTTCAEAMKHPWVSSVDVGNIVAVRKSQNPSPVSTMDIEQLTMSQ